MHRKATCSTIYNYTIKIASETRRYLLQSRIARAYRVCYFRYEDNVSHFSFFTLIKCYRYGDTQPTLLRTPDTEISYVNILIIFCKSNDNGHLLPKSSCRGKALKMLFNRPLRISTTSCTVFSEHISREINPPHKDLTKPFYLYN